MATEQNLLDNLPSTRPGQEEVIERRGNFDPALLDWMARQGLIQVQDYTPPKDPQEYLKKFLKLQGYQIPGEPITEADRPIVETPLPPPRQLSPIVPGGGPETAAIWDPKDKTFWEQARDVATAIANGEIQPTDLLDENVLKGLTLGNWRDPLKTIGNILGDPDFKRKVYEQRGAKIERAVGYRPRKIEELAAVGSQIAGATLPILATAGVAGTVAKGISAIPAVQAGVRTLVAGTALGVASKPEVDTVWNRIKQIPKNTLWWGAFEAANLGAITLGQVWKVYKWNNLYNRGFADKLRGAHWEEVIDEATIRPTLSKEQVFDLWGRINRWQASNPGRTLDQTFAEMGLAEEEKQGFLDMMNSNGWKNGFKNGWVSPNEIVTRQARAVPVAGEFGPIPEKPRWDIIFRKPGAPGYVEPGIKPSMRGPGEPPRPEVGPTPPPPTPEPTPLAGAGEQPKKEAGAAPGVAPGIEAGKGIDIRVERDATTGDVKITVPPWKPTVPLEEAFRPMPAEPARISFVRPPPETIAAQAENIAKARPEFKPPKRPIYKDPFYDAISQAGGVRPTVDYPFKSLKNIFPPSLIRKSGQPMDILAQELTHEFPSIDGEDRNLYDMADKIMISKAQGTYKPDEYTEPGQREYTEEDALDEFGKMVFRQMGLSAEQVGTLTQRPDSQSIISEMMYGRTTEEAGITSLYDHLEDELYQKNLKGAIAEKPGKFALKQQPWEEKAKAKAEVMAEEKPMAEAQPILFEPERGIRTFPLGFDSRGMKTWPDINQAREGIQKYVDSGWNVEMGQVSFSGKGWAKLIDKAPVGAGKINYRGLRRKPEMGQVVPEQAPKKRFRHWYELSEEEKDQANELYRTLPRDLPLGEYPEQARELLSAKWDKLDLERNAPGYKEMAKTEAAKIKEPTGYPHGLTDQVIEKGLRGAQISHENWGPATQLVLTKFDPLKVEGADLADKVKNYLLKVRKFIRAGRITTGKELKPGAIEAQTKEGKVFERPITEPTVEEARPKGKKEVPDFEREFEQKHSGRFADIQVEERVKDAFKRVAQKTKDAARTIDILERRILRTIPESFESIANDYGVAWQAIQKVYQKALVELKDDPYVRDLMKSRLQKMNIGPIPTRRDLHRFVEWLNAYFTSGKGVELGIVVANDERLSAITSMKFLTTIDAHKIKSFLDKNPSPALAELLYDAITGRYPISQLTALPQDVRTALLNSRARMDALSDMIIQNGGLSRNLKALIQANRGRYLAKFYRLHQDRHYEPSDVDIQDFINALRHDRPDAFGTMSDSEMKQFVDSIIAEEQKQGTGFKRQYVRTKRVPVEHYVHRKTLSPAWKKMAGEIMDVPYLILKTTAKQAAIANNAKFLNVIKNTYPDLVTKDKDEAAERWHHVEMRLPDYYAYGELANWYVHPELYKYIMSELNPTVSGIEAAIVKWITNPFKATKTLGSIPTHARNFLGNTMFSILLENSIFNPLNAPYYWKALRVFQGKMGKYKDEWAKLIRDGITETQYYGEEIPKIYERIMELTPDAWPQEISKQVAGWAVDKAGKLYNFEDALYRIAAHYKNIEHFKMTIEQSLEKLNEGMTNYRKLPVMVEILRRYPVFGPFISFKWNVGKILALQVRRAVIELGGKGGGPGGAPPPRPGAGGPSPGGARARVHGVMRLLRIATALAAPALLAEVSRRFFNIDDEKAKKLEALYPSYRRGATFIYFKWKGKIHCLDLTYIWPVGDLFKAAKGIVSGDPEAALDTLDVFQHPLFDAWSILVQGRTTGPFALQVQGGIMGRALELVKEMYVPSSLPLPSLKSIAESVKAGKFEFRPGPLTTYQVKAILDAYWQEAPPGQTPKNLPEEIKNFFTGIRSWEVDPNRMINGYMAGVRSEIQDFQRELTRWAMQHQKARPWEIEDKKKEIVSRIEKLTDKLKKAQEIKTLLGEGNSFQKD